MAIRILSQNKLQVLLTNMKIAFLKLILIIISVTMNAQTTNEKALRELDKYIEYGNLSDNVSQKLKDYFNHGGELDDFELQPCPYRLRVKSF